MKRYHQQGYSKFAFKRIVKKTDKATLFEVAPGIQIWLPSSWLVKLNERSFVVKDHIATDVRLKIVAEQKAIKR